MKKPLQLNLNIQSFSSKNKPVEVQEWVNTALDAKTNGSLTDSQQELSGRKLQLNMTFSRSILNKR